MDEITTLDTQKIVTEQHATLFTKEDQVREIAPELREVQTDYLFSAFIILIIGILTWLKVTHQKELGTLFRAFFANKVARQIASDENSITQATSFWLSIIYAIAISLFAVRAFDYFGFSGMYYGSKWLGFVMILGVLILFFAVKIFVTRMISWIFNTDLGIRESMMHMLVSTQAVGVLLTPVLILMEFSLLDQKMLMTSGLALLGVIFIYRIIKGIVISFDYGISILYLFLYLCTLEIFPLVVSFKWLMT